MNKEGKISSRQLSGCIFIGLLSPAIRLLPGLSAQLAGKSAWLSPVVAAIPALLFLLMMQSFLKNRGDGEGLTHMFFRSIGRIPGAVVSLVFAAWLFVYGGFILRTASERLISSVYENGNVGVFAITTAAAAALAAWGNMKSIVRTAEVFMPIIGFVIIVVLVMATGDVKPENILPVSVKDSGGIMLGAVPIINVVCGSGYFGFLYEYVNNAQKPFSETMKKMLFLLLLIIGIMITTIGTLSANLAVDLQNPFFIMIRNIIAFGVIERTEAIVIGLWVFTDFIFTSSLIAIITTILKTSFGAKSRRPFVIPAAALIVAWAFLISSNAFDLRKISETIIPAINLLFTVIIMPVIFIIGKARKKI